MLIRGVPWKQYLILRETLDTPGVRMTYCEGVLEIMAPSRAHEQNKKMVARLIELYAFLRRLPLHGYGSTTFRSEALARGAEPDECWCVGAPMTEAGFPDLVLEVIQSSPILDKLHIYEGFAISEVWLLQQGVIEIHKRNSEGGYDHASSSLLLPGLDLTLVARFVGREDQDVALQEFAAELGYRAG